MKKQNKIILILLVVVAIFVIAFMAGIVYLKNAAQKPKELAIKNMQKAFSTLITEENTVLKEKSDVLDTKVTLKLNDIQLAQEDEEIKNIVNMLKGSELSLRALLESNVDDPKVAYQLGLKLNDQIDQKLLVKTNKEAIGFKYPEDISKYLAIKMPSQIAEYFESSDEEIQKIQEQFKDLDKEQLETIAEKYYKELLKALPDEDFKKVEGNGSTYKIEITIRQKDVLEALVKVLQTLKEDNQVKQIVKSYEIDEEEYIEYIDEAIENLNYDIESYNDGENENSEVMKITQTVKNKNLTNLEIELTEDDQKLMASVDFEYSKTDPKYTYKISLWTNDEEGARLDWYVNKQINGSKYVAQSNVVLQYADNDETNKIDFDINVELDTNSQEKIQNLDDQDTIYIDKEVSEMSDEEISELTTIFNKMYKEGIKVYIYIYENMNGEKPENLEELEDFEFDDETTKEVLEQINDRLLYQFDGLSLNDSLYDFEDYTYDFDDFDDEDYSYFDDEDYSDFNDAFSDYLDEIN